MMIRDETMQSPSVPVVDTRAPGWNGTTFDGGPYEATLLTRKKNLRSILSAIGRRWPLGGIDCENDELTGNTIFWAKQSVGGSRILIRFPNELLNTTVLARERVEAALKMSRSR